MIQRNCYMCFWGICFCCVFCQKINAQESLPKLYQRYDCLFNHDANAYSQIRRVLDSIIAIEVHQNPEKALLMIDLLVELHLRNNEEEKARHAAYATKGFVYSVNENQVKALEYYQQYIDIMGKEKIDDGYFMINVGNVYYDLKLYKMALIYYQDAEKIFAKRKYFKGLGTTFSNYCLVAQEQNQLDTALYWITKTLALQQKHVNDVFQIGHTYQVIGRLYSEHVKDYKKAIPYYEKAIELLSDTSLHDHFRYSQFIQFLAHSYMRLGQTYCNLNQLDKGLNYMDLALEKSNEINQSNVFVYVASRIGKTLFDIGKYNKAEALLLEAKEKAIATDNQPDLILCYKSLNHIYQRRGAFEKALSYASAYDSLQLRLNSFQEELFVMNDKILHKEKIKQIEQQQRIILTEKALNNTLYRIIGGVFFFCLVLFILGRHLKKQNIQIEEQHQLNKTVLQILGHDLRAPIGVVMTNSHLLTNKMNSLELELYKKHLGAISMAAKNTHVILDGLMQWITFQQEKIIIEVRNFELLDIINAVLVNLKYNMKQQGIIVEQTISKTIINSDASLFQVILRNILINAIKNTPTNGLIEIKVEEQPLFSLLKIENEGAGIDPALLKGLFEKEDAIEIAKKGGGLGLKIVKQLCDLLNLDIRAYNDEVSKGAVFEIKIPKQQIIKSETINRSSLAISAQKSKKLSTEEKKKLYPYALKLKKHEVFEASAIQRIIEMIKEENELSPTMKDWVSKLDSSIYLNNSNLYTQTLEAIFHE